MFKKQAIQQGRIIPASSNWGEPVTEYLTTFYASAQPFTGDDHLVNDQFSQFSRDLIVIYDTTFDIKFNDRLWYNGLLHTVVYVHRMNMGVLEHLEVFVTDTQDEIPSWVI